jgi:hypothetical protein
MECGRVHGASCVDCTKRWKPAVLVALISLLLLMPKEARGLAAEAPAAEAPAAAARLPSYRDCNKGVRRLT